MQIGLEPLILPHTREEFLSGGWPHVPVAIHGLNESIRALRNLSFLQSREALTAMWPFAIRAHLPDASDESSAIEIRGVDAEKVFANKMSLLFNNVERLSPLLVEWLAKLARDLGLPMSTYGRCMVYATPDGGGTATHFDQNINFVLQLHGTKTWWLAENETFQNPTARHTLGQTIDPELSPYQQGEFPKEMPSTAGRIELKPGSLLFVPRGTWHRTEATGDALALNFTFNQPTFIDVFTLALRSRLMLSPAWRELADGVTSRDVDRRLRATEKLEMLLHELADDVPNWQASDILQATEGDQGACDGSCQGL